MWKFALNFHVPRVHNFRVFRGRGGDSIYLQCSRLRTVLIYDKRAQLRAKNDPLADAYPSYRRWTRLEVQLKGARVPYRSFLEIHRYAEEDLLKDLIVSEFKLDPDNSKHKDFLASTGLRFLVDKYGLQAAKKIFPSATGAYHFQKFFKPGDGTRLARLSREMNQENEDWLHDRIFYPRTRRPRNR